MFGTGPVFGGTPTTMLAWFYDGGGQELYRELTQDILGLNVVGFFGFPMPAQPFGWFKEPVTGAETQGLQVPHRRPGRRSLAADGHERRPAAGRRDRAGDGARRHRRLRVQQPDLGPALRLAGRGQELHARSYHQASESFEFMFNKDFFDEPRSGSAGDPQVRRRGGAAPRTTRWRIDQYSTDLQKLQSEHGVNVHRTPQEILDAQLEAWDRTDPRRSRQDPFIKKVLDSQRAWVERVVFYELMNAADLKLAYEHYFPGKI